MNFALILLLICNMFLEKHRHVYNSVLSPGIMLNEIDQLSVGCGDVLKMDRFPLGVVFLGRWNESVSGATSFLVVVIVFREDFVGEFPRILVGEVTVVGEDDPYVEFLPILLFQFGKSFMHSFD